MLRILPSVIVHQRRVGGLPMRALRCRAGRSRPRLAGAAAQKQNTHAAPLEDSGQITGRTKINSILCRCRRGEIRHGRICHRAEPGATAAGATGRAVGSLTRTRSCHLVGGPPGSWRICGIGVSPERWRVLFGADLGRRSP